VARARVVLAEDHPAVASELRALLAADYDVIGTVSGGRALVNTVDTRRPDVIVTDIAMPGGSGLVAAADILKSRPDTLIIFVTVQDDRAVIQRALELGARGYLLKCDAGDELVSAVRAVMAGGRYLSTSVRAALRLDAKTNKPDV
jgi:DNA-binding NarL/FixJ family response regulator